MTARIDHITLTLDVADEGAGRRTVTFEVPLPDDTFVDAVRLKWHEYTLRLWEQARAEGATGSLL